ncbi:TPA: restriction endonuclease subunit S [Streptococcus suis]
MTKEKPTEPRLRFPEFTDAWKQRKAMDIFKPVSDKGYTDLPILSASQEYGMVRRDEIGIDIKFDKEAIVNYKRVLPGQFVIHLRSFQGGFAWSEIEGVTSPAYTILDFREINSSKFWQYVLTSPNFIKKLETVTYGIRDGRSISYSDFSTLGFVLPTLPEQEAIGAFFSDLDQLITLHQRKLDSVKELKKALLQKMFPKGNGNDFPELRFPGFTDAWKQRKLGEVVYRSNITSSSKTLPRLEFEDINSGTGTLNKDICQKINDSRRGLEFKEGDILFGKLRPYLKNWWFAEHEGIAVGDFWNLKSDIWNNRFLYTYVQSKSFQVVANDTSGTKMPRSDWQLVSKSIATFPTLPEQEAIGSFFFDLDQLITLHQRQLDHLKLLKKALLQQMFI